MRKLFLFALVGVAGFLYSAFRAPVALAETIFESFKPSPKIEKQVSVFDRVAQAIFSHDAVDKLVKFAQLQRIKQGWTAS